MACSLLLLSISIQHVSSFLHIFYPDAICWIPVHLCDGNVWFIRNICFEYDFQCAHNFKSEIYQESVSIYAMRDKLSLEIYVYRNGNSTLDPNLWLLMDDADDAKWFIPCHTNIDNHFFFYFQSSSLILFVDSVLTILGWWKMIAQTHYLPLNDNFMPIYNFLYFLWLVFIPNEF